MTSRPDRSGIDPRIVACPGENSFPGVFYVLTLWGTVMRTGSIYTGIPAMIPAGSELFEDLAGSAKVRIERIVSDGHASPEGFWYDQEESEWVMVLQGRAGLRFEAEESLLELGPGDWVDIPAHVRHRVEWTDLKERTVWLAVFY